jgi:hypothetical protein
MLALKQQRRNLNEAYNQTFLGAVTGMVLVGGFAVTAKWMLANSDFWRFP